MLIAMEVGPPDPNGGRPGFEDGGGYPPPAGYAASAESYETPTADYVAPLPGYEAVPAAATQEPLFELRFGLEADDAYDASVAPMRLFIIWFVAGAVVVGIAAVVAAAVGAAGLGFGAFIAGILLIAGALLLAPTIGWFVRRQYRSLDGQQAWARLDGWGLRLENPLGRQDIPWASLTDIVEAGRVVLFRRDTLLVAYVPTSAFVSTQQEQDALAFARQCIDARQVDATYPQG
jgi:hypothetical protein